MIGRDYLDRLKPDPRLRILSSGYRHPVELGLRGFAREQYRRAKIVVLATLFVVLIPVIVVVGVVLLILLVLALLGGALVSGSDDHSHDPQPAFGMHADSNTSNVNATGAEERDS
jgi:hypothetical protein